MGSWKVWIAWDDGKFASEYTVYNATIGGHVEPYLCGQYKSRGCDILFPTGNFPFKWIKKMEKIA